MTAFKVAGYLLSVLIPLAFINCQETPSLPGLPTFPGIPSIPGIPSFPGLPSIRGARQAPDSPTDSPPDSEPHDGNDDHQNRFFFSFFPTVTSCNYTAEPGRTCRSCTQALRCLPNGVGILHTCHDFFSCIGGTCIPGAACTTSTTTESTSTTTTSTTTTTAASGKK